MPDSRSAGWNRTYRERHIAEHGMSPPHATWVRKFGFTPQSYLELAAHGCQICGHQNPDGSLLSIDHDHETGAFRGLLCRQHNAGIGFLGDDERGLIHALAYLKFAEVNASA